MILNLSATGIERVLQLATPYLTQWDTTRFRCPLAPDAGIDITDSASAGCGTDFLVRVRSVEELYDSYVELKDAPELVRTEHYGNYLVSPVMEHFALAQPHNKIASFRLFLFSHPSDEPFPIDVAIALDVSDVEVAMAFYRNTLGAVGDPIHQAYGLGTHCCPLTASPRLGIKFNAKESSADRSADFLLTVPSLKDSLCRVRSSEFAACLKSANSNGAHLRDYFGHRLVVTDA